MCGKLCGQRTRGHGQHLGAKAGAGVAHTLHKWELRGQWIGINQVSYRAGPGAEMVGQHAQ